MNKLTIEINTGSGINQVHHNDLCLAIRQVADMCDPHILNGHERHSSDYDEPRLGLCAIRVAGQMVGKITIA